MRRLLCAVLVGWVGYMADVVLWSDTFEAGTALSVDYTGISDVANTAAVGLAGSRGAKTINTASEQYYGDFTRTGFTPDITLAHYAEGYFDHGAVTSGAGGFYAIEVRRGGFFFLSLYHDVGTNRLQLTNANAEVFGDTYDTADNVYTPGTFVKIRLEWKFSTIDGSFNINVDGWAKVYVDDVLVIDTGAAKVMTNTSFPTWDRVTWGPMGTVDNIEVGYITVPTSKTAAVFGVTTTVTGTRAIAFGLDGNTNTHSTDGVCKVFGSVEVTGTVTVGGSISGAPLSDRFDGLDS